MDGFIYPNEAELQWSILIVVYPFVTGLVAGAFIVSSLYHVFGVKALRPVARFSLLTALAFLLVAPLPLQAHLGRPERAFEIFLKPNFSSAMAGFGYIWLGYLLLVVVETWLVFRPDIVALAQASRGPKALLYRALTLDSYDVSEEALRTDGLVIKLLAAIGIPAAVLLHGYVGFIFGAIKANPWWSTPLMPVIFLLSAIVSGIALLLVMYVVVSKLMGRAIDGECVHVLAQLLFGALVFDLALEGLELLSMSYEREESWDTIRHLVIHRIGFSYIGLQGIVGSLLPLAILFIPVHRWPKRTFPLPLIVLAGVLVTVGIFAMRWNVVIGGQLISKSLRGFVEYRPVWGGREGIFAAGLLLMLPFYIFAALTYLVPPWPREPQTAGPTPEPHRRWPDLEPLDYRPAATDAKTALRPVVSLALALTTAFAAGALLLPGETTLAVTSAEAAPSERTVFGATLRARLPASADGWAQRDAVAATGGRLFLAGDGGVELVEIDAQGRALLKAASFSVESIRALNADRGQLLAASAINPKVMVLAPDGGLVDVVSLPPTFDGAHAIPTGVARTPDGRLFVADAAGGRLLVLDASGALQQTLGGGREGPRYLLQPGSLAAAADGTVFLADVVAGTVYRVADSLPFPALDESTQPGAQIYEPLGLAVDGQGRLYVADGLLKAVQVFADDGTYLGLLGNGSPADPALEEPVALFAEGNTLYVLDRTLGLLVFDLP